MRVSKRASVAAISAVVVLAAAACSGGGDTDDSATAEKTANGAIVVDGSQPEVGLIPANTTETGGGDIIDYMWSGLVRYDNKTGKPSNLVAESIESPDSKVYTIKIKAGTKFHDGT